jgi:hypothetical protein
MEEHHGLDIHFLSLAGTTSGTTPGWQADSEAYPWKCPTCHLQWARLSSLLRHVDDETACGEAKRWRAGRGEVWELLVFLRGQMGLPSQIVQGV